VPVFCYTLHNYLVKAERRICVRHQDKSVSGDTQTPPVHTLNKVKNTSGISAGEKNRKPGDDNTNKSSYADKEKNNIMGNRQEPFDQRQPPVQVLFNIGIIDFEMDRLLFVGGRVIIGHERNIRTNPGS